MVVPRTRKECGRYGEKANIKVCRWMQWSLCVSAASWEPCRQSPWIICLKDKRKKHFSISSCAPLFERCHQNISSAILPGFHAIPDTGENPGQKARRHSVLKARCWHKISQSPQEIVHPAAADVGRLGRDYEGGIFDDPFVLNHGSPCLQVSKGILDQWINMCENMGIKEHKLN